MLRRLLLLQSAAILFISTACHGPHDNLEYDAQYYKATMDVLGSSYEIKMKLRGGLRFCDSFPHFKLKFKDGPFAGISAFKMVTHGDYKPTAEAQAVFAESAATFQKVSFNP